VATFGSRPGSFGPGVECCVRMRLGYLSGERTDRWWDLLADEETEADMRRHSERDALPYLARFESRESLLRELEQHQPVAGIGGPPRITCALILALRRQTEKARDLLKTQVQLAGSPKHSEYVQESQLVSAWAESTSESARRLLLDFLEGSSHPPPGHIQRLRQYPRLTHHRHEIRICHPARQHVHVNVSGDPGPGGLADIHP
jgi:hypothetical protein